jgi:hypothetical protein
VTWRDLPPTEKQLRAIRNIEDGYDFEPGPVPKTRGEASDRFQELQAEIAAKEIRDEYGDEADHYFSEEYPDPF